MDKITKLFARQRFVPDPNSSSGGHETWVVKEDKKKFRVRGLFESLLVRGHVIPSGRLILEHRRKRPVRDFRNISQDDSRAVEFDEVTEKCPEVSEECLDDDVKGSHDVSVDKKRVDRANLDKNLPKSTSGVRCEPVIHILNHERVVEIEEVTEKCREVSDECLDDDVKGSDNVSVVKKRVDRANLDKNLPESTSGVRCEPVIDILFAKVFTDSDESLDVYGDIKIIDLEGSKSFLVYERGLYDSPQCVHSSSTMNNFLQLSGPQEIPTFNKPHLVVDIRNVDTGAIVARGHEPLPKTTDRPSTLNDFESLYTLKFQGDAQGGGLVDTSARVELQCVAFRFGVYAQVEMFLHKDDVNEDGDAGGEHGVEVYGLISAKCHPWLQSRECYENHMFNAIPEEHEWVRLGTKIFLSKNLVAVPAYSELEISLDLKGYEVDEFIVQGTACFRPANLGGQRKVIRGENGFYVLVHVIWCEPSNLNESCCEEERIDDFYIMPHSPKLYASNLLEVFSLFIAHPNRKDVYLYGSVEIQDSEGWCTIFSHSKEDPYFLPWGHNLLPLLGTGRAVAPLPFFLVKIDIHDMDGHVNIKGFVNSSVQIEKRQRPWFDRLFCAVVRVANEKSFAAVNYTLFSYSIQAILTVHVVFKSGSSEHVKILGNITASYDKRSTSFDTESFRRVLYTGNIANFVKVENGFQLCSDVVAVPMTSSLLCEVNLTFPTYSSRTDRVEGLVKFQIGERSRTTISGSSVDIYVTVDWNGFPYVQQEFI